MLLTDAWDEVSSWLTTPDVTVIALPPVINANASAESRAVSVDANGWFVGFSAAVKLRNLVISLILLIYKSRLWLHELFD